MPEDAIRQYLCPECRTPYSSLAEARACARRRTTELFEAGDLVTSDRQSAITGGMRVYLVIRITKRYGVAIRSYSHGRVLLGLADRPRHGSVVRYIRDECDHKCEYRKLTNEESAKLVKDLERKLHSAKLMERAVFNMNAKPGR